MAIQINGNGTITGISVGGLPDGIVDTDMIAASAVTSAKSSGLGGLSMADNWHVNAALQPGSGGNTITSDWTRGTGEFGSIGSAMTQSSGVFTFPSTGIYYISINGGVYRGTGSFNYIGLIIQATTDNSNYNDQTVTYNALPDQSGNTYSSMSTYFIFDVTNTSTHKVRFQTEASGSGTTAIDIGGRRLNVIFMKLGDT